METADTLVAVVAEAVLRARVLCWAVLPHVKEEDGRTGLWISGRPEEGRTLLANSGDGGYSRTKLGGGVTQVLGPLWRDGARIYEEQLLHPCSHHVDAWELLVQLPSSNPGSGDPASSCDICRCRWTDSLRMHRQRSCCCDRAIPTRRPGPSSGRTPTGP